MNSQETILIADDGEINRAILRNLFERDYNLLEAENGEQALILLRQYRESITVVLLDLIMPVKDGYGVLEEMREDKLIYHSPVIVITADDSMVNRTKVFELGASDVIAKPFDPAEVKNRVKNIIELGRYRRHLETLVAEQSARTRETNAAIIDMLSSVIEYRSLESGQHIRRIRMFTRILLEDVAENYQVYNLDARKIQLITDASSLHDIGKIAIPDSILNKPGKLTAEEFEIMKTHSLKGCELLTDLDRLRDQEYFDYAYQICRYHHERWDGKGYPDGLKGDSIPICAQVVAIADCYDALTTDRVYKKAIAPSQAFSMILNGECGKFSPKLLECFKNVRDKFAQLSAEYADHLPGKVDVALQAPEGPVREVRENTLEQSQLKYFALLRHLDSTVMEVDLDTGVYHIVYLTDQDFSSLRSGSSFEEAVRNFARNSVHPDDRADMLKLLDGYIQELFDEGMTCRDRSYRILDRESNAYVRCRASILRINLENPRQHRVLLIWHKENSSTKLETESGQSVKIPKTENDHTTLDRLLGGVQKCRCDRYFTLIHINRSLLDLLHYSEQEIAVQFHNRLIELVYAPDRERMARQFREQRNEGKVLELEYRFLTKDGRIVWVSDHCMIAEEDGAEVAYCAILDITRSKQAEEELRLSLERHKIIMEQTNDIIFEWDIVHDKLYLSANWEAQYGYSPITEDVQNEIPRASHLHPDDMPVFVDLMNAMTAGVTYKEAEFRIADSAGIYRWRKVRATAQFDIDHKPFKAVGVILDIDSQKAEKASLEERAARDALTGLYNKGSAQSRAEAHFSVCDPDDLSALMILDVDDFKLINDRYGHMFGDAVLVELSEKTAKLFRGQDTVARVGGDEFLIFMPNVQKREVAEQRAEEILSSLQDLLDQDMYNLDFSCSIGMSFARGGKTDFQDLFDHADRALYRAKSAGKNRYVCYEDQMQREFSGGFIKKAAFARTEIDSDQLQKWSLPVLIMKAFDILYDAEDFYHAVQSILALIGEMFGISRTYIFESSKDGLRGNNTFEWCAEGVEPQIKKLQQVPYIDDGHDYRDNFGSDGLFYCRNIRKIEGWERELLEDQAVLSTLQYAIRENGIFYGLVGFDDCRIHRLWTSEQIDALSFVGRLLSVFLLKYRTQEALSESVLNLHAVLDKQEAWLYVLDPDTYVLRYVNDKTKKLVPDAEPGRTCYEVFYKRDTPCVNCLMGKAQKDGQCTMELYNEVLKLWVMADASMMSWNRREACLICCRDISYYKEKIDSVQREEKEKAETELQNRRLAEQVEASNEILHVALEHTAACEFYYYPQIRDCIVPQRTCEIYHCRDRYQNMPYTFAEEQVDQKFYPVFLEMYDRIHRGERTASCEFRRADGHSWCRETMTAVTFDEDGKPHFVIGIVENITHQKEMEDALESAKSRDKLTGLYNRESGIRMAQECLVRRNPGEHCVMMLLDMDNFKQINTKEGSLFADAVLQDVADILRAETKPEDILIRLGGDEFMLLIRNCNKKQAAVTGPRIAGQVKAILADVGKDIQVSVSIGMCSTEVTVDYNALYRCAESTLKYVKEHGKGQAACYLDTSNELGIFLTQLYGEAHLVNEIEADGPRPDEDLVSFALELLGKSKNLDDAVFLLLSRIGKIYHFSRVSIIEANREYLSWHFSYQWAEDRSKLQLGQDFYVSVEDFDMCSEMYDEDGLADHNVRDGISDIASCLHAGIWNYGEYVGSMSFEIDRKDYKWTPEQRKLLKELVKIVPSFVMKSKADAVSRAKTDFLSRMSHEIRTPMNAISGMTSIAKSVLGDRKKTLDCLEKIESANGYLLGLINDILDMSRIESGKLEINRNPMDLSVLLASLESLFGAQAKEKGLNLRFEDGRTGNRPLLADSLRLNQVLVNIIGNAVKFTDHGGILVRIEELEAEPRAVLRFSVTDTGAGIEASAMPRIFNAFEQAEAGTAAHQGGTGLGLSISSRLVQMMGGMLEARSEIRKGSEFYFTLALDYAGEEILSAVKSDIPDIPIDFRGRRLLLAEDNDLNREIAQTLLEMKGFAVDCAVNGKEALDLFCAGETGRFDAILMDIRMPVMDGLEATKRIRTSGRPDARTVPILALSANAFDEDTKKSIDSGMNGHLSKPIQVEELLSLLNRCINHQA